MSEEIEEKVTSMENMSEEQKVDMLNRVVAELRDVSVGRAMEIGNLSVEGRDDFVLNVAINYFTYMISNFAYNAVPKKKRNDYLNQVFIQVRHNINKYIDSYSDEKDKIH